MRTPRPFEQKIFVTRPLLPPFESFSKLLEGVWARNWLTNKGQLHDELEMALCNLLRTKHLSLVANGTLALVLAYKALELKGDVVVTPFTFPATISAAVWCGLTPVFADIDPVTLTLDPERSEQAITERTTALIGVHVYGMPCDVERLGSIGERHNLRVVYDAAHAFGTEISGIPIVEFGDATILSFHATKLFNTAEGGAVAVQDVAIKQRVDLLKNIGIQDEATVVLPGINARMNELEAALGLANLEGLQTEWDARANIAAVYRTRLARIDGIRLLEFPNDVRHSQQYFVVRVDGSCAVSRDQLYEKLMAFNVFARRYFYPLCSNFPIFEQHASSRQSNLSVANRVANEVLCLPLYGELGLEGAHRICDMITHILGVK